jgi:hypothetical protein
MAAERQQQRAMAILSAMPQTAPAPVYQPYDSDPAKHDIEQKMAGGK